MSGFARIAAALQRSHEMEVGLMDRTPEGQPAGSASGPGRRSTRRRSRPTTRTTLLPQVLSAAVEARAHGVGLVCGDRSWTYAELDAFSTRLARLLIERGVGPGDLVVVSIPRSIESVAAVWAVAKSGAGFVPVDPAYPAERIEFMISDSGAKSGLTVAAARPDLPDLLDWIELDTATTATQLDAQSTEPVSYADRIRPLRAEHVAWMIYTSGSTGRPKGVEVTHTGIAGLAADQRERFGVTSESRVLHVCSPSFDVSVLELLLAVSAGATFVVAPATVFGGTELESLIRDQGVTHAVMTPSVLSSMQPSGLDTLEVVGVAGEACPPELVARWAQPVGATGAVRRFLNAYGPTETTIISNATGPLAAGDRVGIGPAIRGVTAEVLDARLHAVPLGVVGELYIAGPGVARGYHNRPGLTATRFVAHPGGEPGARMYRTGDVVRPLDNDIEYLGRSDFQVKIRGYRIELGEIDAVLTSFEGIDFAVTVGHQTPAGPVLVSYIYASRTAPDVHAVRDHVAEVLPAHMVPGLIMTLDEVPLTPVGKLDRGKLPPPVFEAREFRAPQTTVEKIVADVFADVLGTDRIGLDDDFFDLGGNSLVATQVAARLGAALDVALPARLLFETSTVAGLAATIEPLRGQGGRVELTPQDRSGPIPLSLAQNRMWFLNQFDPSSAAYAIPLAVRLSGRVDPDALRAAIADVVERHEVLRTVYPETADGPVQVILPAADAGIDVDVVPATESDIFAAVATFLGQPFDVANRVPLRVRIFQLDAANYVLAVAVHHISGDGASMAPLARDVMLAYAARVTGEAPAWSPLAVQYADFAIWQRRVLGDESDPESLLAKQVAYWREQLSGLPEQLDLPSDRPRPAQQSFASARVSMRVDADLHARLAELAQANNATLFMLTHTALAVVLGRLANSTDVAIGAPYAGRGEAALDDLVGMFVNTVVFRSQFELSDSFTKTLARQRDTDLAAFANADVPFERLVEVLNPTRSTARHPLFQVLLAFQNLGQTRFELPDLTVDALDTEVNATEFDLQIGLADAYDATGVPLGIDGTITYATDLFDTSTIERIADRFVRALEAIATTPDIAVGDIGLIDADERALVLREWNATAKPWPATTVPQALSEAVGGQDDSIAVVAADGATLSYREFAAAVNRLARWLIAEGVGPEDRVAIAMGRSVEQLITMHAVLTAGGAYVPIDPSHPAERNAYVLETAAPTLVLTRTADEFTATEAVSVDGLDLSAIPAADVTDADRFAPLRPHNAAYVLFTSGSTGRPKGVAVPHYAVVNQLRWLSGEYQLGTDDVVLVKTPFTFDVSVWEYFAPPLVGARMVVATPDGHRDPAYLAQVIAEQAVTITSFVPSMLAVFTQATAATDLASLRALLVAGEALPLTTAADVWELNPATAVHNLYGPTEATVHATAHRVVPDDPANVPMGTPVANTGALVLDSRLQPVPVGVAGELYLTGVQVARGYFERPDLTTERFVADPYSELAGARMYRTGDLVRWRANGELEYLGRTDFQVKLRGLRIELGEIEAALREQQAVTAAVAVVHRDPSVGDQLIAYLVPAAGQIIDTGAVRDALAARVPAYMIPSQLIELAALPLNASGKLDRRALPEPVFAAREFRAPQTPVEEIVANVFAEVLGIERVGADDDFFELGGNSLLAAQVTARIGAALDARIPVRVLFEASTVSALAARAESQAGQGRIALTAQPRGDRVPLSLAQTRMWFLNRFDRESAAYTIPFAVRLTGSVDAAALTAAVGDVITRHEVLRTIYPETPDGPVQVVLPVAQARIDVVIVDTTEAELVAQIAEFVAAPFDVTNEVPIRVRLYRLARDNYVLAVAVHHISGDGSSMGPLARDVMTAYAARANGDTPGWAPLEVQYADYAIWQRRVLGEESHPNSLLTQQVSYWREQLAGLPDQLDLPADRARPAVASQTGAQVPLTIPADLHAGLVQLGQSHNATLFMVVHAALALLFGRLGNTDDLAIGTPYAGRGEAALDDLVGMFVNTVVFRTNLDSAERFTDLLARQRETDLAAFAHADVPFERLVEVLKPARSTARHPLFQVMLAFQNLGTARFELPGLTVTGVDADLRLTQFDLHVTLSDSYDASGKPAGITGTITYATDLFDEPTVTRYADMLSRVLTAVVTDPTAIVGDVDLIGPDERARVVTEWNATEHPIDRTAMMLTQFERTVAEHGDRLAVVSPEGRELTYREFASEVNRLARHLISVGVGPEARVAIAMRRSLEQLTAIYAVLTAGGAYVPVDPDHPAERNEYVLTTAAPVVALTTSRDQFSTGTGVELANVDSLDLSGYSDAPLSDADRLSVLRPANTAYIIFTSGSTGRPKGVAVPHGAVTNQLLWIQGEYDLSPSDVYLQKTAGTFDVSVWGNFWPLAVGACLVLATADGHRDPQYLADVIQQRSVTVTDFVPSMLSVFTASVESDQIASLRAIFAVGEALPPETVAAFSRKSPAALHNLYGPTEAAVSITFFPAHTAIGARVTPIGGPVWNSQAYVLDGRLRPVPVGVAGELYLGGIQLARGYRKRPDITSDRFVADPFGPPGDRLYRTGDLVRWNSAGDLEYLGRTDFQVKFHGQRIELGEIETALLAQDGVNQAAALVLATDSGDQLVGYAVPEPGAELDLDTLRQGLAQWLPSYMIPTALVVLDAFPLNPSGKLDRKALPAPVFTAKEFRAPTTPVEQIVATIFADVLGLDRVGADDDFFELGGNSLLATQVTARLGEQLDTRIPVRVLFESSTVTALAANAESHAGEGRIPLTAQERSGPIPLSLAQTRMWFLNRFDSESAAYIIPLAVRLSGRVDLDALRAAIGDVVTRHEVLRTLYPETPDGPVQVVLPVAEAAVEVAVTPVAESDVFEAVTGFLSKPFDVTSEVPLRVRVFELDGQDYVLAVAVHHISGDGSSMGPLARDVMVAYAARANGEAPGWSPLAVQYADYALWQRRVLGDESDAESLLSRQIGYWRTQLADLPEQLDLPSDRPRPARQSLAAARVPITIEAGLHAQLQALAQKHNATLFMVVHTALAVLLGRLGRTDDVAVGTPYAGRGEALLDELVGMFVNTVVFRTRLDAGESFVDLLARQRDTDLAAYANADVPFERLVEVLNPERSTARHPLFQVVLAFQNMTQARFELPGLSVSGLDVDTATSDFDLQFMVADSYTDDGSPAGISGMVTYATDLFDPDTVSGFVGRLVRVLGEVAAAPQTAVGQIELLGADERADLLHRHGTPAVPGRVLADMLVEAAALDPAHPALVFEDRQWSYGELDERSNRLGRWLISRGIGPEDLVAAAIPRSVESVWAVWSIAKSGAAFAQIDPRHPRDRIEYMLETARSRIGFTVSTVREQLPDDIEWVALDDPEFLATLQDWPAETITDADRVHPVRLNNPAYAIFTSGSTGRPKGVVVTHTGLANFTVEQVERYELSPADRTLHFGSPSFDASILELLLAIGASSTMIVAAPTIYGGEELKALLAGERVTRAFITPAALASIDPAGLDDLVYVSAGGEALAPELAARWANTDAAGVRKIYNGYGPTETTVMTNISDPVLPGEPINIGGPIRGMACLVLDDRLRPVPEGVAGELYLSGIQLGRGYVGRPDITADRFVADPYGVPGERMYRTGDVVAWRGSVLEYVSRADFQVKMRGFRIELGEIESALRAEDSVDQAAVFAHRSPTLGDQLVAYVVPVAGAQVDPAALIAAVGDRLPGYMVPRAVMVLDAFPLTVNGKLDRKALPEPVFESRPFKAPSTPVEEIVAGVFADVLGVERVGADDDFFELGGNSLLATQVTARIGAALDTRVPVRVVFEASTVSALAAQVESHAGEGRVALGPQERPDRIPLSLAQTRMWFLNRFDRESAAYTIPFAVRLTGAVDVAALTAAVADVVARHEVLRTVYPETPEGPVQVVLAATQARVDVDVVDAVEDELVGLVAQFVAAPFDVTAQIPLRVRLFRLADDDYVLAVAVHHISGDGSSMGPLARDVMSAYAARAAGEAPGWVPLGVQYADYAIWQRRVLGEESDPASLLSRQIGYWKSQLAGLPDQLDLPADRPRPVRQSFAGGRVPVVIPAEVHAGLVRVAQAQNATMFMVVHTGLAVLLGRLAGVDDVAVGTPYAGRGEAALDDLVGMFVNTVVFRTRLDPAESFTDLLARQRETDLAAFAHADVPFERLVEVLNPARSTARHPLFQVGLSFQNLAATRFELPGLTVAGVDVELALSQFDLHWIVSDTYDESGAAAGISGMVTYATDLFDPDTVSVFAQRLVRVLTAVAADPGVRVGDIDLLDAGERTRVLTEWNATAHPVPEVTLASLFADAVVAHGDGPAVVDVDGTVVSYAQFAGRVYGLARWLIDHGVGPEDRVVVAMSRHLDQLVALYAVVVAGGVYVPVDPDHPAERSRYVIDTAAPVLVLDSLAGIDLDGLDTAPVTDADRRAPLRAGNAAYVIFTSGSTGRPKGVAVSHGAVANQMLWVQDFYAMSGTDVVAVKTPFTFDLSVWEYWSALTCGARVVLAPSGVPQDPALLWGLLEQQRVSLLHVVPSMLDALLGVHEGRLPASLRAVLAIGEALPAVTAQRAISVNPDIGVWNLYGPTEAAVSVTAHPVTVADTVSVPIGAPEWNVQCFVLDERLHPVPVGVAGELYLGGAQLARGYHDRAELTAERFVAHPWVAGARLYRTGDVVAWTATGELDYVGRSDFQVKVRGFRIELGEIETALHAVPGVAQAVVLAVHDARLGDRLVAYLVPEPGTTLDITAVKTQLGQRLPSYMVPAAWVALEALPLTVNGKLDRKALPAPVFEAKTFRAPATPVEEIVAGVFADVLGLDRVGVDDDFFELGGNSLLATQVTARVGAALDTTIAVRVVFEAPTVAGLAAHAESHAGDGRVALTRQDRPERVPLSLAQNRMWFLNRFDTTSIAYTIPFAVRLSGDVDIDALRTAVADVIARHEVLRTVYPETPDGPVQVILPVEQAHIDVDVEDVDPAGVFEALAGFVTTPFDVTTQVPVRVRIYHVAGDGYVLAVAVHHISGDGSSMGPLARDVMIAYAARANGDAPSWAPLAVQYADYAIWQRHVLGEETDPDSVLSRQVGYWRTQLAGLPEQLDLPTDRPRPVIASYAGAKVDIAIDADTHTRLVELAQNQHATMFMVVHTALAVLLARLANTDDVAIGTPIAGRGDAALDDLVGMFVNTIVFRTQLQAGESFTDLLARQRDIDLAAYAHADVPFERLVEVLNPARSTARHPLFQVMLAFQNMGQTRFQLPGLTIEGFEIESAATEFDLQLMLADTYDENGGPAGIGGQLIYATDLFDHATVAGIADRLRRVLVSVAATPAIPVGDINFLDAAERIRVVSEWNSTQHAVAEGTLPSLFDAAVAAFPDNVAVVADTGTELTYAEFSSQVNRLAHWLLGNGVGPEVPVAIAMKRSLPQMTAIYGVLAAGGTYVPIDPEHPVERNSHILATTTPRLVLTTGSDEFTGAESIRIDTLDLSNLPDSPVTDDDRPTPLRAENTAYVIFTSGSTGQPKGVALPHHAVINQLQWLIGNYDITPDDAVLIKTPATFDVSVWEYFTPLQVGARAVLASADGHRDPAYLSARIAETGVTLTSFVPSMLAVFAAGAASAELTSLRALIVAGEALPQATAIAVNDLSPSTVVHNLYGPTETTIHVCGHPTRRDDPTNVPIGGPAWNTLFYLLDSRLHPVPVGVAGELYIGGDQLARGYHGRPDLTAERFVASPFGAGERLYRSGDLMRWTPDGELQFMGRTDFQVKLRGLRIELGEVEAALHQSPSVAGAVAVVHTDPTVGDQLVAYLTAEHGTVLDVDAVRDEFTSRLPGYMVPNHILVLPEMPVTASGKLDRKALPVPVIEAREFRAPSTPTEEAVAAVFAELLGVERVGADDDFFELGGNSLIAARVASMLGQSLGVKVQLQWLFLHRTVADLAARLATPQRAPDADDTLGVIMRLRDGDPTNPIFVIHAASGIAWPYVALGNYLDSQRAIYGIQTPAMTEPDFLPESLDDIADRYVAEIRRMQPQGPYTLVGWSLGGLLAHTVAAKLQQRGETIAALAMLDSGIAGVDQEEKTLEDELVELWESIGYVHEPGQALDDISVEKASELLTVMGGAQTSLTPEAVQRIFRASVRSVKFVETYEPPVYDGDVLFITSNDHATPQALLAAWQPHINGKIDTLPSRVNHTEMLNPEGLDVFGATLDAWLKDRRNR
ncbi:amino acid adenylation domain-containing protein [Skermania sp. ID1734]|uniref:non-ribosomal peptide synthase/polyketide synthase n=1 Tax=Skermania sp. ID1734 TaxID=2597516 RepID=UPI00117EE84A|nr:non-ribosomal peptide synthase/polyketide synthase [Skermania sp. ID1734]TSE02165.1 amino acid adenylation domain-containing protein [Skermania sp. ID1734]